MTCISTAYMKQCSLHTTLTLGNEYVYTTIKGDTPSR